MDSTVTRSRVRGKHPFAFSLDIEQAFDDRIGPGVSVPAYVSVPA